jgi:hypothetical protein
MSFTSRVRDIRIENQTMPAASWKDHRQQNHPSRREIAAKNTKRQPTMIGLQSGEHGDTPGARSLYDQPIHRLLKSVYRPQERA